VSSKLEAVIKKRYAALRPFNFPGKPSGACGRLFWESGEKRGVRRGGLGKGGGCETISQRVN